MYLEMSRKDIGMNQNGFGMVEVIVALLVLCILVVLFRSHMIEMMWCLIG